MTDELVEGAGTGMVNRAVSGLQNVSRPTVHGKQNSASDPLEIYLGEIKKNPILARAEEQRWAKQFDEARRRKVVLLRDALETVGLLQGCRSGGLFFFQ